MARVRLKFVDANLNNLSIEVSSSIKEPLICILIDDSNENFNGKCIFLDLSTAIKLSKSLRTEINKIKEVGDE